jgi:hypothetical protein
MLRRPSQYIFIAMLAACAVVMPATAVSAGPGDELQSIWSVTTSLLLAWDPPDQGRPFSYIVEAGSRPGLSDIAAFETGNSRTSVYIASVPPGIYYVRVRARNGAGVSEASNEITVSAGDADSAGVSPCPAPHPPTGLTSTIVGSTVAVRWSESPGATSYHLEAGSTPGAADLFNANIGNQTAVQAVLPPGNYFVQVRAVSECGTSEASALIGFGVGSR